MTKEGIIVLAIAAAFVFAIAASNSGMARCEQLHSANVCFSTLNH